MSNMTVNMEKKTKSLFVFALSLLLFFLLSTPFVSAFFALYEVNSPSTNVILASLESTTTPLAISIDPAFASHFEWDEGLAGYKINRFQSCSLYDDDYNCIDGNYNLCPYIGIEPNIQSTTTEVTEVGFLQDASHVSLVATGEINGPTDAVDDWNVSIKSPCFEGECPADYDSSKYGNPLPQSLKGKVFNCDLSIESIDPPVLAQRILSGNTTYASSGTNIVTVSAVFTGEVVSPPPTGNSSVMFFPGVMSSRLYEELGTIDCGTSLIGNECFHDDELWLSTSDSKHTKLSLNTTGKSLNPIYTKDDTQSISDEAETGVMDEVFGANVYNSFITELRNWKNDGIIPDYAFIPYDWRLSLNDIITFGASTTRNRLFYNNSQNFSESYILKKLQELQQNSGTGKVTLIGHSNGGLVIKALVQKLKDTNNPIYNKIDKIIFVAVPQVGTPDAVVALLHGKGLGYGLIMDNARSRDLSENMPAIYNLLPSEGYFSIVDPGFVVDKVATFEDKPFFNPQTSEYGLFVSNNTELKNYILGTDGRSKPAFDDTVHPNIGNSGLYADAQSMHAVLDLWQPASTTKVIQIAGWGEETIAGVDYKSYLNSSGTEYLSYKPRYVVDGDGTVVVPSALWMSTSTPNVERWWVDLWKYNDPVGGVNRKHRDILEIPNILDFISSTFNNTVFSDSSNIVVDNASTLISSKNRLHYTLHSPLTLGVTDSFGRYTGKDPVTGKIREEIPDVNYEQIGDVQFISTPNDLTLTLKLKGLHSGSFSLDVDKQVGNNIIETTSFQGVPSTVSTLVEMNIVPNTSVASSTLKIDGNGDGIVDKILEAKENSVTVYDSTPPELQVTFSTSTKDVVFSAVNLIDPNPTILTTSTSTTLIDNQGNTTVIPFTKFIEFPTRFRFTYNKIIRNGVTTNLPNTDIVYDWQEKKGVLTDLDTRVVAKGVEKYVFNYRKATNTTVVREKTRDGAVVSTKPGLVVVTVKTDGDLLKISY